MVENTNATTVSPELIEKLDEKLSYLAEIRQAIVIHDDRLIYELLERKKYQQKILEQPGESNEHLASMVENIQPELSHLLAHNLIAYLSVAFPFFYYKEIDEGVYQIYFGNWWDRRNFGYLDVLNIKFVFDEVEYKKLTESILLAKNNQRLNTNQITSLTKQNETLQMLVDTQDQRDLEKGNLRIQIDEITNTRQGLFTNSKLKEQRDELLSQLEKLEIDDEQAKNARKKIIDNNDQILFLSKEDTILGYEQKNIKETFGSFTAFEQAVEQLYVVYLSALANAKTMGE